MVDLDLKNSQTELAGRLQKLMLLRLLFVSVLLGASVFLQTRQTKVYFGDIQTTHYFLIATVYLLTFIYILLFTTLKNLVRQAYLQLLADSFFITAIIYSTGGIGLEPSSTSDKLVMGFLDKSSNTILQKPISLILAKDPNTRINVGGKLTPKLDVNLHSLLLESLFFLIFTSIIVFIGLEIWHRIKRNQLVFYLSYKHNKLPETTFLGEDTKKNLNDTFVMILMSAREKLYNINKKINSRLANIQIETIKNYFDTFDRDMLPSILLSLIFICLILAILLIITDSHIIEDIFYPYVVIPIINAIK